MLCNISNWPSPWTRGSTVVIFKTVYVTVLRRLCDMHLTDIQHYTFCVHTESVHCPNTAINATEWHLLEFFWELYWNLVEIRYIRVLFVYSGEMFYSAECHLYLWMDFATLRFGQSFRAVVTFRIFYKASLWIKLKTYRGWCPFKGLSNDTTLMQIQSGRTVPLKYKINNFIFSSPWVAWPYRTSMCDKQEIENLLLGHL
jgi:hypothetical protein